MFKKKAILIITTVITAILLLTNTPANALISQSFIVNIEFADSSNPFAVSAGDTFLGNTTYDETLLTGGGNGWYAWENLSPLNSDDNFAGLIALSVPLGNVTFNETDDREYPYFPSLFFSINTPNIGDLIGIDLVVDIGSFGGIDDLYYTAYSDTFRVDIMDGGTIFTTVVEGSFDFSVPVPEPSTIVLIGLGIAGFAGFGRKKFTLR